MMQRTANENAAGLRKPAEQVYFLAYFRRTEAKVRRARSPEIRKKFTPVLQVKGQDDIEHHRQR